MNKKTEVIDQLNAFIDDELDQKQREEILQTLDDNVEMKSELCDLHRIKELMTFSYPLETKKALRIRKSSFNYGAIAASLFIVLGIGFVTGYLSNSFFNKKNAVATTKVLDLNDTNLMKTAATSQTGIQQEKVIIYLGHTGKKKFTETLDKAEELLTKYRNNGTEVYVVTSAGGIDLLRDDNTDVQKRISQMKGLNPSLHFVACNNQIYHLYKKGQSVNLVKEAEVAPSAVQFVVDHLKDGWRYIAI